MGFVTGVVWSLFAPQHVGHMPPVFKYRLELAESPVLAGRAEAVARQSASLSAPACLVPQGRGAGRAAGGTPCPGDGWDVCWHPAGFCARGSRGTAPARWWWRWCVGVWGREEAGRAPSEASPRATGALAARRERGVGVRLSCAESPSKICSLVSYWVLFLSPVLSRPGVL